jgi:hypothetical protein
MRVGRPGGNHLHMDAGTHRGPRVFVLEIERAGVAVG